jgi:TPP-dependent pyruvate/acetoin dehydrogenase alpha subunit
MSYVPAAIRAFWERRDPIALFTAYLCGDGGIPVETLDAVDRECAVVVEEGLEWARAQPDPDAESVRWRVFKD